MNPLSTGCGYPAAQRPAVRLICLGLVLGLLAPLPAPARSKTRPINAETAEEVALFFALESMRRLRVPLVLRLVFPDGSSREEELERIRQSPPRLNASNVVYPFGDKNALSMVLHEGRGVLSCRYSLSEKRGTVGGWGLTGPEMAAVLNEHSTARERGGAEWSYDPIRDSVGLQRDFSSLPADDDKLYRELNQFMKTGNWWFNERFVKRLVPLVEARQPPASASAEEEGFGATLVLRHFSQQNHEMGAHFAGRYLRGWDRKWGHRAPRVVSDRALDIDQLMYIWVHFEGAGTGEPLAEAAVYAKVRIVRPDGSLAVDEITLPLWRGEAPPGGHLQIGMNNVSFSLDADEPRGDWTIEARVCEDGRDRCVDLRHDFVVR